MPHIIVSGFTPPKAPSTIDGVELEFASNDGVVGVKCDNERFLIRWFDHKHGTIIKPDKATRIARLAVIKKALQAVADNYSQKIVGSTISEIKENRRSISLKTPHFFTQEFDYDRPLWIEVGFGSGRHILQNAKDAPDVLHVGIEVHKPSAEQLIRRIKHEKLDNIVVILSDARVVLETIATASVERIFVHFPVPWDDAPTKRVYSERFILESLRVLKKDGTLELRTDSKNYFDYALDLIKNLDISDPIIRINNNTHTVSKYEERWRKMDKDIYDLIVKNNKDERLNLIRYDFTFKNSTILDPIELFKKLESQDISEEYLLKVRKSWQVDSGIFTQVAIGNFNAPQTIYLMIQNSGITYYPSEPLHTHQNFLAHSKIKEIING